MTLLEVMLTMAVVAMVAIATVGFSQGARLYAAGSSVREFDAALAYARALAATSGNGATLVFASDGRVTVYAGRPTSINALSPSALAPHVVPAAIREAELGAPPFTVFLNSAGHASAMRGAVLPGTIIASDPGCPAGETSVALSFADATSAVTRELPCNTIVAGSPAVVGTVPP